jgi:hypothetical protein
MTVYAWIIIGLSAAVVLFFFGGMAIGYALGRSDGYAERDVDAAEEQLTGQRAARSPRHARTGQTRDREGTDMAPPGPFPPVPATRPPWYRTVPPRARTWTDAASIMPVMWAAPGTQVPYRPQPSGTSPRAVTGTMPRVHLTGDDDTGEIRRIGAETIAAIEEGRI